MNAEMRELHRLLSDIEGEHRDLLDKLSISQSQIRCIWAELNRLGLYGAGDQIVTFVRELVDKELKRGTHSRRRPAGHKALPQTGKVRARRLG